MAEYLVGDPALEDYINKIGKHSETGFSQLTEDQKVDTLIELDDLEDEEDGIRLQVTKAEFDLIKRAKEAGLDQGHMQVADQNQQILTMA